LSADPFIYDVAFSFLSEDEPLAIQINDLLQDRLETFLYSKRQGEVAGTDGEETFNKVFGEEARLVVVLYRKGWGGTPWTRIEETAIRRRAYDHGYAFVKFIPLDDPATVPTWLPPTQLWIGMKHFGVQGAAAVIEARAQELGGQPREESVLDRAARLERQITFEERRKQYRFTQEAVSAAAQEVAKLVDAMVASVEEINAKTSLHLDVKHHGAPIVIVGLRGRGLALHWECPYSNSLDGSQLEVSLWDRHPPMPGIFQFERPNKLKQITFEFDLLPTEKTGWIPTQDRKRVLSTNDLAAHILKFYMDNRRE
jgi:hypothetical protein